MNIFLAYARVCYALMLAISTGAALYLLYSVLSQILAFDPNKHLSLTALVILGACIGLLGLVWRIARDKFRGRHLLSNPTSATQWVWVAFMTLLATLGHYFSWIVFQVLYEILYVSPGRDAPGPVGLVLIVLALCYLIALWIGEFVLNRNLPRLSTEPTASDQ